MGNKPTRHRSFSEADGRGGSGDGQRKRSKPTRSQSTSQVDGGRGRSGGAPDPRVSMPDLGGAVPYQAPDDKEVQVTHYHSYGNLERPKSGMILGQAEPDIRIYRRSTGPARGANNKYASLPRNYGRSKSAAADLPNGTSRDYPELRRRELPYDPGYPPLIPANKSPPVSESGKDSSQRTSKRVSAASSLSSMTKAAPITMEDFPTTSQIKRKLKCFEDQFCRSLVDKYAGLADTLQLSALAIAMAKDADDKCFHVSLLDYLDAESRVPVDLLADNQDEDYILVIPEALFHGIMHVRQDNISDLELWTALARDLVMCVGVEAAGELSRMFEYQIVLLTGDSAVRILADHAAACVIEYIKKNNAFLDRNSATVGVVRAQPPSTTAAPHKYLSVILGHRELKWDLQSVLKCPALRKELTLFSDNLDTAEGLYSPWQFFTSTSCEPQLYGYRGLLLEWDWVHRLYKVNTEDENSFNEDISDPMDYPEDFHRLYYPYKRLFGTDFMIKYCDMKLANRTTASLAHVLNQTAGDLSARDHIHPVYRPLIAPPTTLSYATCNFDNVDLTRAQLQKADLSRASVRNSKLLLTDMEGAILNTEETEGTQGAQMRGADVSYTTLAETTMDQQTLEGVTAKHVVIMRPKKRRPKARKPKSESDVPDQSLDTEIPINDDNNDDGTTPVTARPKKKKKRVPKSLDLDLDGSARTQDGTEPASESLTNGHGEASPEPREGLQASVEAPGLTGDVVDGEEDEAPGRVTSFISDSQGNLLEIEQAQEEAPVKAKKKTGKAKVKKAPAPVDDDGGDGIIEQKQKKIREKKKKVKSKRPSQPLVATTPTEPIPETTVFVEEQRASVELRQQSAPKDHQAHDNADQTQRFFTDSQLFKEPAPVPARQTTVIVQRLKDEPGARHHRQRVDQWSDSSQQSATDFNILDDDGDVSNGVDPLSPNGQVARPESMTAPPVIEISVHDESQPQPVAQQPEPVPDDSTSKPAKKTKVKKTKSKEKSSSNNKNNKGADKKASKSKKSTSKSESISSEQALAFCDDGPEPYERPHSVSGGNLGRAGSDVHVNGERPQSAVPPASYIDGPGETLSSYNAGAKALSTTNIHSQPHYHDRRAPTHQQSHPGFLQPRMTKSLSHHGNLGVAKMHNLSFDSQGLGLRTARQIYGLSKEDIEFITRSQIFNMIKGLQIENIQSNLPPASQSPTVLGRDREREDVLEMLSSPEHIVTVTGCYGNGKSALALAVARAIQDKLIVPVVVDARGSGSATSVARAVTETFGLHFTFKELPMFYNWLNCHEQRLLLVLDNLDVQPNEDNRLSDFLDDLLANVKNLRLLCTSRRHFYKGQSSHEVYRLGNLEAASKDLLKSFVPDLHDEGIVALAEVCADNPLALSLVSRTFLMDEIDTGKLFEELAQSTTHTLLDRVELALFDITEDEAELDILRKLTSLLLKLLDNIPLAHAELLVNASHFAASFDVKSVATLAERNDTEEVQSALDELSQTGLVLKNGERYVLPTLVKFVNQSKLATDGSATVRYFEQTVDDLKLACAQFHSKRCEEATLSYRSNYDNYVEVIGGIIEREDVYEMCPSFASLEYALFLGECLPNELYHDFYDSFAQEAEDNDDVAKQCRALCCLAHKLVMEQQTSTAREVIDGVRSLIQARSSEVSDVEKAFYYRCVGKLSWEEKDDRTQAVSLVKKALDLYKLSLGARDLQTIFTNELYAWMLTRKESHQTARHFYNISDLFVKEMMDEHPLLIDGYDSRRSIWDRIGLFQRATDTARKAVDVSKKFYGEHPTTAKMMTHLCEAIIKRGSLNDAISAGIDALAIRSKVLGDHVDTGQSYKTLAYLMLRSGQYDEAVRFGQSAVDIFDRVEAPEKLLTDAKNIISQARSRLDYKSHVYIELQGREAAKKNAMNGHQHHKDSNKLTLSTTAVSTVV